MSCTFFPSRRDTPRIIPPPPKSRLKELTLARKHDSMCAACSCAAVCLLARPVMNFSHMTFVNLPSRDIDPKDKQVRFVRKLCSVRWMRGVESGHFMQSHAFIHNFLLLRAFVELRHFARSVTSSDVGAAVAAAVGATALVGILRHPVDVLHTTVLSPGPITFPSKWHAFRAALARPRRLLQLYRGGTWGVSFAVLGHAPLLATFGCVQSWPSGYYPSIACVPFFVAALLGHGLQYAAQFAHNELRRLNRARRISLLGLRVYLVNVHKLHGICYLLTGVQHSRPFILTTITTSTLMLYDVMRHRYPTIGDSLSSYFATKMKTALDS